MRTEIKISVRKGFDNPSLQGSYSEATDPYLFLPAAFYDEEKKRNRKYVNRNFDFGAGRAESKKLGIEKGRAERVEEVEKLKV